MLRAQTPGNLTSNITSLGNVSALKAEVFHQSVKNTSDVTCSKVPIQWGPRGKCVTGQRRYNQVIGQGFWRVFLSEPLQYRQKLEEAPFNDMSVSVLLIFLL